MGILGVSIGVSITSVPPLYISCVIIRIITFRIHKTIKNNNNNKQSSIKQGRNHRDCRISDAKSTRQTADSFFSSCSCSDISAGIPIRRKFVTMFALL